MGTVAPMGDLLGVGAAFTDDLLVTGVTGM
jgi:hypothetical protein